MNATGVRRSWVPLGLCSGVGRMGTFQASGGLERAGGHSGAPAGESCGSVCAKQALVVTYQRARFHVQSRAAART